MTGVRIARRVGLPLLTFLLFFHVSFPRCGSMWDDLAQPPRRVVVAEEATGDYRRADGIFVLIKVSCRVLYGLYSYGVHIVIAYVVTACTV